MFCKNCGTKVNDEIIVTQNSNDFPSQEIHLQNTKEEQFGNGLSLRYFKFIYFLLPFYFIYFLLNHILYVYNSIINTYGSFLTFITQPYNRVIYLLIAIQITLLTIAIYMKIKKNRMQFSRYFILYLISEPVVAVSLLVYCYIAYPAIFALIKESGIRDTISWLTFLIPNLFYFYKRTKSII